ncbi:hypothetical protein BDF19DRAFT_415124 [Syncephalis fuscata]|nr:hypothetical protein BDF19DRAFT_415124 [Syncephalis fuscata]
MDVDSLTDWCAQQNGAVANDAHLAHTATSKLAARHSLDPQMSSGSAQSIGVSASAQNHNRTESAASLPTPLPLHRISTDVKHLTPKSSFSKFSKLTRARSITMPSLPQSFSITGDKKLFGKSDKKNAVATSPELRRDSSSSQHGLRSVVSGFMRKKNTAPSISERSDISESSLNDQASGNDTTEGSPKKSTMKKLRRKKVALEADKRVSILAERDTRGWDVDVLFTEAEVELERLKQRSKTKAKPIDVILSSELDKEVTADKQSFSGSLDSEQTLSTAEMLSENITSMQDSMNTLHPSEPSAADTCLPDVSTTATDHLNNHSLLISNTLPAEDLHSNEEEKKEEEEEEEEVKITDIYSPLTTSLRLTASPLEENPTTPATLPMASSSNLGRNRRSCLSITRTRSGRLRLSPASSVAVTALHSEPVVSMGRASGMSHGESHHEADRLSRKVSSETPLPTFENDKNYMPAANRKSRSGDLLRALAIQADASSLQDDRPRHGRMRAYTTSAAATSRPNSYVADAGADSFRRRPQPTERSWRIFSWFVRSRETSDTPPPSDRYSGNGVVQHHSSTHYYNSNNTTNHHNHNMRRRQPARPSVRSIWPTTDGFGQPSHMLRQKLSQSNTNSSTDLKHRLLRPWSAVEPIESMQVDVTEQSDQFKSILDDSESIKFAATLGMQVSPFTSKQSIPRMQSNTHRSSDHQHHQPRPLSSPSLLYGGGHADKWWQARNAIAPSSRSEKPTLSKQSRHSLATFRARLSATRLALMIAASPRSSGNAMMYRYSDLYNHSINYNRPRSTIDLNKTRQYLPRSSYRHRSSPYEAAVATAKPRPISYQELSTSRFSNSRRLSSTIEAAGLRFSSTGRRRRSELMRRLSLNQFNAANNSDLLLRSHPLLLLHLACAIRRPILLPIKYLIDL